MSYLPDPTELHDDGEKEEESNCGQHCHPESGCSECAPYWGRMIKEGYWDSEHGEWTSKGWREITRTI